jgi:hypothetical protein
MGTRKTSGQRCNFNGCGVHPGYSIIQEKLFNNWRLFYRINTLSDMTNSQGTHIQPRFLNIYGINTYQSSSLLQWPNQVAPSAKYFTNWLHVLRVAAGVGKDGKLNRPLGRWLSNTNSTVPPNVQYLLLS